MLNSTLAHLRIGTKVLSIAVIALIGFIAILVTLLVTNNMRSQVGGQQEAALSEYMIVQNIAEDFLNARRREKDFLLRKDKIFADKHDEISTKITGEIKSLLDQATSAEADGLKKLQDLYADYDTRFKGIAGDTIAMGLTADDGLLGKLRKSVHEIEDTLKGFDDPQLTISMLMMRRHEKDFIAREDPKYIDNLTKERAHFDNLVKASTIAADAQAKLTTLSSAYDASFQEMAKLQLTIKDKLKGMSDTYAAAEPILEAARSTSKRRYDAAKVDMQRIESVVFRAMIGAVIVIGLVILALASLIGRGLSGPVRQVPDAMRGLSAGGKSVEVAVIGTDEVAQMASAFAVFRANLIRAEQLAVHELEAQHQRAERARLIEQLTAGFDQDDNTALRTVASATTDMQATASSMTSTAEETSRQSTVVASASEEASMNVQTVATATEELAASASEISRQVTQSAQIAGRAVADADRTNTQIQGLAEAAQKIGEAVKLINDIASQTNLVAFKATMKPPRTATTGK